MRQGDAISRNNSQDGDDNELRLNTNSQYHLMMQTNLCHAATRGLSRSEHDQHQHRCDAHDHIGAILVASSGGNGQILDAGRERMGIGTEANHLDFAAGFGE